MNSIESFADIPHHEQYRHILPFASAIARELNIAVPNIRLGYDPFHGCCFDPSSNTIFLNQMQLDYDKASPLMVLAHEMRHAYQWQKGMLNIRERWEGFENGLIIGRMQVISYHWLGQEFDTNGRYHHELPWEIDAIAYEEEIARRINVKPFPRPERDAQLRSA